jgi:hypothetical protein
MSFAQSILARARPDSVRSLALPRRTDDFLPLEYAASVHEPVTQRERQDAGRQASGYHFDSAAGVSIGGSSPGVRRRARLRSLRQGPSGR